MGLIGILGSVAGFIRASDAGTPITLDEIVGPLADIRNSLAIVDDVLTSANDAARRAVTVATDAGAQIETIGGDVKWLTHHTYEVVLPHSMSWLVGYMMSMYVVPLTHRVDSVERTLEDVRRWRTRIDEWRARFVDPNITEWIGWHKWWDGWPQGVVFTVHDWLEHPAHFGEWAAQPVTNPIIEWLSRDEHRGARDNLSNLLVRAWADHPEYVWAQIEEWLIANP